MDVGSVLFDGPLFADYHQLYVQDAGFTGTPPPTPAQWTDEDVRRRLNVNESSIVVSTARNMTVPFRLAAFTRKPEVDGARYDHVVESGLFVPSGQLVIAGLLDEWAKAARAQVKPGHWGALALFEGLGTLSADGLDGEDRYRLFLWPATGPPAPRPIVHKQWEK